MRGAAQLPSTFVLAVMGQGWHQLDKEPEPLESSEDLACSQRQK